MEERVQYKTTIIFLLVCIVLLRWWVPCGWRVLRRIITFLSHTDDISFVICMDFGVWENTELARIVAEVRRRS